MRNRIFFLLSMLAVQLFVGATNELDVRLDQQDLPFQEELKRAQDKLEQEKLKNRQFLSELRLLAAGDESYAKELSGMVALAMQPLAELVEQKNQLLAALRIYARTPAVSGGPYRSYVTDDLGKYIGGQSYSSQADADQAAIKNFNSAYPPTSTSWTSAINGYSATSYSSQADADSQARTAWLNAKMSSGVIITSANDYAGFGWKTNPSPAVNIELAFTAVATGDIYIALKYATSSWIEIILGGWGNSQSYVNNVTNVSSSGAQATCPNPVLPDRVNPVSYSLKINNGTLTITATLSTGATSNILTYANPAWFNQPILSYSFKGYGSTFYKLSGDMFKSTTFTSTFNGITKTSTASQADADAQAKTAWAAVETSVITPSVNAYVSAQAAYQTELNKTKTMVNELIDLFKADPVSTYSVAAWAKV